MRKRNATRACRADFAIPEILEESTTDSCQIFGFELGKVRVKEKTTRVGEYFEYARMEKLALFRKMLVRKRTYRVSTTVSPAEPDFRDIIPARRLFGNYSPTLSGPSDARTHPTDT